MKEKDIREKIAEAQEKVPDWMDDENIRCRYGGPFTRKRPPKEVHPHVEVEIVDSTEEVTKLLKKSIKRSLGG
jgi:hypothetical protein